MDLVVWVVAFKQIFFWWLKWHLRQRVFSGDYHTLDIHDLKQRAHQVTMKFTCSFITAVQLPAMSVIKIVFLMIHTTWVSLNIIMLDERSQTKKKVHSLWFHLYKVLENANDSVLTESRLVVASGVGAGSWICSFSWWWWWFLRHIHTPKLIKLCTLNVCSFLSVSRSYKI